MFIIPRNKLNTFCDECEKRGCSVDPSKRSVEVQYPNEDGLTVSYWIGEITNSQNEYCVFPYATGRVFWGNAMPETYPPDLHLQTNAVIKEVIDIVNR